LAFGRRASLLLEEDEDLDVEFLLFEDLTSLDELAAEDKTEESFFFDDDDDAEVARDLLALLLALLVAFCERVEDVSLASSLDAFDAEDVIDLESDSKTEADAPLAEAVDLTTQ
jgi:hypothetical protein